MLSITLSSNAIKYMDKPKGIIQIRIKDVGDLSRLRLRTMEKVLVRRICLIFSTVFTVQMFHEILPKAEAESVFPL